MQTLHQWMLWCWGPAQVLKFCDCSVIDPNPLKVWAILQTWGVPSIIAKFNIPV